MTRVEREKADRRKLYLLISVSSDNQLFLPFGTMCSLSENKSPTALTPQKLCLPKIETKKCWPKQQI